MADALNEFHGSYAAADVTFLLTVVPQELTEFAEKERLIQSGLKHYCEMLSEEHIPSARYLALFDDAVRRNGARLAKDIGVLADHIAATHCDRICLVSLARAGTPIGVLLRRALTRRQRSVRHASVSIIAGRGIDIAALDYLRRVQEVADDEVVFVDGWTGKGVISDALSDAIKSYNTLRGSNIDSTLHVMVDLCGRTRAAATTSDYLIPSCLLGATVSGLVSRSILNDDTRRSGAFHGCRSYAEFANHDRSRAYVDEIDALAATTEMTATPATLPARDVQSEQKGAAAAIARWCARLELPSSHIKVGIGEATRVLLRRVPRRLVVRHRDDADIRPTVALAEEKGVPIDVDADLPWAALAVIEQVA